MLGCLRELKWNIFSDFEKCKNEGDIDRKDDKASSKIKTKVA